jgi:DNA-binding Lrp family transcriptional regulator
LDIDDTDIIILKELQEDFTTSYRDIAKKLGLSVGTVHNRVKKLKEIGVIKSFAAVLDAEKLGFELTAVLLIQVEGGDIIEVERAIAKSKSVVAVYDTTGEFDIIAIAKFRSRDDLNTFIKETLKMGAIKGPLQALR